MPVISSKARTLEYLSGQLRSCRVLPLVRFAVAQWVATRDSVLAGIQAMQWGAGPLIVRSSAAEEDRLGASLAGHYLSVADVLGIAALAEAIDAVCRSMAAEAHPHDEVLVQPMLNGVHLAGVAFTADSRSGGPYYIVEFSRSGMTDEITSGRRANGEIYIHFKGLPADRAPVDLRQILMALNEIEDLLKHDALDVEFAIDGDGVVILQVRALSISQLFTINSLKPHLAAASEDLGRMSVDDDLLLSCMSDWNPAEMIGTRPRRLALTLYRELLTDDVWAVSRAQYGFRPQGGPLLVDVFGHPYIDVPLSLASFVPVTVDDLTAIHIVEAYLAWLREDLTRHDKIEFEVALTSFPLDLTDRLAHLRAAGVSTRGVAAVERGLRLSLLKVLEPGGPWHRDMRALRRLSASRLRDRSVRHTLRSALAVLDVCRRDGSLPFAGLARAAFMATDLVASLQRLSPPVFTPEEYTELTATVVTVAQTIQSDLRRLSVSNFLARHGHLRPGTYDVLVPRYDEAPARYIGTATNTHVQPRPSFVPSPRQCRRIDSLLASVDLPLNTQSLLIFYRRAVAARERGKYLMARHLSTFLVAASEAVADLGLDTEDLSHLSVAALREASVRIDGSARVILRAEAAAGRERAALSNAVQLPDVLTEVVQVHSSLVRRARPTFVTTGRAVGPPVDASHSDLVGAIVFVEAADPGYDYIFATGLAGLVTQYGGPNSHMAVRAQELAIPAVIGAGRLLYERWRHARQLYLDCSAGRVEVLR